MVDFRYHIVSIVAVFLALAVGIVLGAGPLKDASDQGLRDSVRSVRDENNTLRDQLTDSRAQTGVGDQFAAQVGSTLVAGRLPDAPVVLVVLPGADNELTDQVSDLLEASGASITGTLSVRDGWTGTDADARLRSALSTASPAPAPDGGATTVPTPGGDEAAASAAAVLAGAIVGQPGGRSGPVAGTPTPRRSPGPVAGVAEVVQSGTVDGPVLRAFARAGLVDTGSELTDRAGVAVVLAPAAPDEPTSETRAGVDRLTLLVRALRAAGSGTVVAGPAAAAEDGGVVQDVRADPAATSEVSTVDSVDRPAEAVAVVLALVEQVQGGVGDYGAVGTTDGALPAVTGLSTP